MAASEAKTIMILEYDLNRDVTSIPEPLDKNWNIYESS
jgi:hypothetical protein